MTLDGSIVVTCSALSGNHGWGSGRARNGKKRKTAGIASYSVNQQMMNQLLPIKFSSFFPSPIGPFCLLLSSFTRATSTFFPTQKRSMFPGTQIVLFFLLLPPRIACGRVGNPSLMGASATATSTQSLHN